MGSSFDDRANRQSLEGMAASLEHLSEDADGINGYLAKISGSLRRIADALEVIRDQGEPEVRIAVNNEQTETGSLPVSGSGDDQPT